MFAKLADHESMAKDKVEMFVSREVSRKCLVFNYDELSIDSERTNPHDKMGEVGNRAVEMLL